MNRFSVALIFLLLTASPSAFAQWRIGPILEAGNIRLSAGLDIEVSRFGAPGQAKAVVKTTAFTALRNADVTINAMVPQLNQLIACGAGKSEGGKITGRISLYGQGNTVTLTAPVNLQECMGQNVDANVSIPMSLFTTKNNNKIQLKSGQPSLSGSGLVYIGARATGKLAVAERTIAARVLDASKQFDQWVNAALEQPFVQTQVKEYNLKIEAAGVNFNNGDLVVTVVLSGQVPIADLERRLNQ